MDRWLVQLEVSPHSTGRGHDVDQVQAGQRVQSFAVATGDFHAAFAAAEFIAKGVLANPIIWKTRIFCIRQLAHGEQASETRSCCHEADLKLAAQLQMPRGDLS